MSASVIADAHEGAATDHGAVAPWDPTQPHAALAADVRWWAGSPVSFGLFGRLALDQVAYREVAAAVDASGRFKQNFTNRGIRSYLWGPLLLFGDDVDRRATADRLKQMHGAVRGRGKGAFADVRYSALNPDLWKWVAVSSQNIFYAGYIATFGEDFTDDERQVVYSTLRYMSEFGLPSEASQTPETFAEAAAYYEDVASTKLADNEFLQWANRQFDMLPVPTLFGPRWLHALVTPLWRLVTPVFARPVRVCSEGASHPRMRELLGVTWTRRRQREYRFYLAMLRFMHHRLPKMLTLEPLAYNRYRYERLRTLYGGAQLETFAPPS